MPAAVSSILQSIARKQSQVLAAGRLQQVLTKPDIRFFNGYGQGLSV